VRSIEMSARMSAGRPDVECVVIGAGAVGLACAYQLASAGREVLVLEAEKAIGQGISSRNSEVIHAGIYYAAGSAKARFCVAGRKSLYDFCEQYGVAHQRCGKIIVAADAAQADRLQAIKRRGDANGVDDLRPLSRSDLRALEPELRGVAGLLSPSTGIIDSHAYMLALQGALEAHGGAIAFQSPVISARCAEGLTRILTGGPEGASLTASMVVLSGGLGATALAREFEGLARSTVPETFFARGNYFTLGRRAPFSRLIYPTPEPGGLGVHLTLDLAGQTRFGPDVEWLAATDHRELDYAVDPARAERFYAAIRQYWPDLRDGELFPAYSGIRPKLARRGEPDADFIIHDERTHGAPGVVALYGVESPGLTSSLAIGAHVEKLSRKFVKF